ncbi:MAG: rod shape-determining protein MreD [Lachnospiraceae bacterium]|nr:rod shape-determining protein MreD [Lachnospiraceae bacterium]
MKRLLFYIVLILLAFLIQNNILAVSPLIDATPNLLLIITFCFGFIRGKKEGMLLGFFCGLLMDICYGESIGYYALIYLIIGYVNGTLGQLFYTEFLNMPLLLCILSDLIYNLYIYVFGFLLYGRLNLSVYVANVILPEVVYTAILTLVLYKLFLKLNTRLEELEKRSAKRFV